MPDALDHYRLLGRSGLRVSPLTLGTMNFEAGGTWSCAEEDAARIIDVFLERGGNFIDTANFYGRGAAEALLGRLLTARRQHLVISTKYSLTMHPGDPNAAGNHRKSMVQAVEDSLRRLQTDYIDLLYLHMWDARTPVEEILRAFDDLVRQGKILYAGISDTPAWQVARMQVIAELRGWSPLIALQIPYSLAERTVEREFLPMAAEMGLGVQPWSPLAGGVLTGKYRREDLQDKEGGDAAAGSRHHINLTTGRLSERTLDIADAVREVAQATGYSPAQVALAWTLRAPAVASTVIGVRTAAQLDDNLAALEVELDGEHAARLDAVSRIERGFPHDMLESARAFHIFGGVHVELPRGRVR